MSHPKGVKIRYRSPDIPIGVQAALTSVVLTYPEIWKLTFVHPARYCYGKQFKLRLERHCIRSARGSSSLGFHHIQPRCQRRSDEVILPRLEQIQAECRETESFRLTRNGRSARGMERVRA